MKSETYNDIIERLISVYEEEYLSDFTDEEAAYYNERIKQFGNGNYEGTRKVDLDAIKAKKLRWEYLWNLKTEKLLNFLKNI